jgi:hypothetical protein
MLFNHSTKNDFYSRKYGYLNIEAKKILKKNNETTKRGNRNKIKSRQRNIKSAKIRSSIKLNSLSNNKTVRKSRSGIGYSSSLSKSQNNSYRRYNNNSNNNNNNNIRNDNSKFIKSIKNHTKRKNKKHKIRIPTVRRMSANINNNNNNNKNKSSRKIVTKGPIRLYKNYGTSNNKRRYSAVSKSIVGVKHKSSYLRLYSGVSHSSNNSRIHTPKYKKERIYDNNNHRKREMSPHFDEMNINNIKNEIITKNDLLNNNYNIKSQLKIDKHLSNYNNKLSYHKSLKKDRKSQFNKPKTIRKNKIKSSYYSTNSKLNSNNNNNNKKKTYTIKNTTSLGGYISHSERKKKIISTPPNNNNNSSNITNDFKLLGIKDIKINSLLGEGAFAKVYLCNLKKTSKVISNISEKYRKKYYAMKIIERNNNNIRNKHSNKELKTLIWERYILSKLSSKFIVSYYGSFIDSSKCCILLDFIIGGELLYHFENSKSGK